MTVKELCNPYDYVRIYELNRSLYSPTMYGALLYKGVADKASKKILSRQVFRILGEVKNEFIVC